MTTPLNFITVVSYGAACDGKTHLTAVQRRDGTIVGGADPRRCDCPAPNPSAGASFILSSTQGILCDGKTHVNVIEDPDGSFALLPGPGSSKCKCPAPGKEAKPVDVSSLPDDILRHFPQTAGA